MAEAQKIAKNATILMLSEFISRSISFVLVIILARYLKDVGLGQYYFIYAFVGIFYIISDFGLSPLMTRDIAKDKKLTKKYVDNVFSLKIILCVLTAIIPFFFILFTDKGFDVKLGVLIAGVATSFGYLAYPFRNVFVAYERQIYHAIYSNIERIIAFTLGIAALYMGFGLIGFFIVLAISNFSSFLFAYFTVSRKFVKIGFEIDAKFLKKALKESLPFWFTLIFITFYFKISTVMLGFMSGFAATGWYNAAYKIIDTSIALPFLVVTVLFPVMSRLHKSQEKVLSLLYNKAFYYLYALAIPLAVGVTMMSDRIILFVYKSSFENSAIALQILIWAAMFIYVNYVMGFLLNSIGKQALFTYSTGICAVLIILLNFLLIPKYSYAGAALATVIIESIHFLILIYLTERAGYRLSLGKLWFRPVFAGILMAVLLYYLQHLNLFILVPMAATFYFLVLFLVKGLGKEEINILKLIVQKQQP